MTTPLSFKELVSQVVRELEGAFALLFKSNYYPGELVGCKCGSPLLLGIKTNDDDDTMATQRNHEFEQDDYHHHHE